MSSRMRLGDILVEQGAITSDQLDATLAWRNTADVRERLGDTILRLGYVTELELATALARQLGIEVANLDLADAEPEIAGLVSIDVATDSGVLPLWVDDDGALVVAMADPTDIVLLDDLRVHTGYRTIRRMAATPTALRAACLRLHPDSSSTRALVETIDAVDPLEEDDERDPGDGDAPVVRLANQLLLDAHRMRASDLHIEPTRAGARVRVRVDGLLKEVARVPRAVRRPLTSRIKIMAGMDIAEHRRPQDGRFRLQVDGEEVDVRMSAMPAMHGETLVMRLLRRRAEGSDPARLGLAPELLEALEAAFAEPQGMVVVTGPTGSGKTSTLYAGLHRVADETRNVITLEDPIEYELDGVNQTQVHPKIGLSFASGLRTVLRQDPDVVFVGEIRDGETAVLAVEAAMTGHLVLSTLHTNDSVATIARLVELGVERSLLAESLRFVLSQRLVRVVCEDCAEPAEPDPAALRRLGADPGALEGHALRRGRGCPVCLDTGYRGRHLVAEGARVDAEMAELVASAAPVRELRRAARSAGMRTLREDALRLALAGVTTLEEVLRVTPEDPELSGGELIAGLLLEASPAAGTDEVGADHLDVEHPDDRMTTMHHMLF